LLTLNLLFSQNDTLVLHTFSKYGILEFVSF